MQIPEIASKWRTLLQPRRFGRYVNDHTLYYDGRWHLIGITSRAGKPNRERYFVHAVGESLQKRMHEYCKVIDNGTLAWAPCVTEHDGLYYMFYGPAPTKLAVSFDSGDWFGQEIHMHGNPPMACHRDHFVLRLPDGGWVMYVSGVHNGKSAISCLSSSDLLNWAFCGFALTSGENAPLNPSWGAFESPFVVQKDGLYYLFTTYTDCSKATYHDTLVFASADPFSFGCYGAAGGAEPLTKLFCHAPEIVSENGNWYITTCGWRGSSFAKGAVKIAELRWK